MEQFEILTQKTNEQIEYICCQSKGLRIKVIPPQKQPDEYQESQMIITANFYARHKSGEINTNININYDFEVVEPTPGTPVQNWNMGLFFDAIHYYCQKVLKREADGVEYSNNYRFYPYGGE